MQTEPRKQVNVLIAIQARSTSTRFPQKIFKLIDKKSMLTHVIDRSKDCQFYIERPSNKIGIKVQIAILHPEGDNQIVSEFRNKGVVLISGDEQDVLSRYFKACDVIQPDYIVRLTSDCPLIPSGLISKHINTAVHNSLDYVNNVDEKCRLIADGHDCEVLSMKAVDWLRENAKTDEQKEHVTLAIRQAHGHNGLLCGFVATQFDTSKIKLSVDTPEDLEFVRAFYHSREYKKSLASNLYGRKYIYEY